MRKLMVITLLFLASCTTNLTEEGALVRVINEAEKANCEFIKLISVHAVIGPDNPGNALKKALNEAASVGANRFFIITNVVHWADGTTIVGEALRCKITK